MPTIFERVQSRSSKVSPDPNQTEITLEYMVFGTDDELQVRTLVEDTFPDTFDGQVQQNYEIRPIGGGIWEVQVHYAGLTRTGPGVNVTNFEITATTQHILVSKETILKAGLNPPNCAGGINVTRDNVEGCDVVVPQANFSETWIILNQNVTDNYKKGIISLVGTVNDRSFKGFQTGEVLFMGASGSLRGDPEADEATWEVTFHFAISQSASIPLTLAGELINVEKEGWFFLWVKFADVKDGGSNTLVKQPQWAYVERVYDYGDFRSLDIGM